MCVPARLGVLNSDIGRLPADLAFFERVVASSDYGPVSRTAQADKAARRANARIRALLRRFRNTLERTGNEREIHAAWKCFAAVVRDNAGTLRSGKTWDPYAHYSFSPFIAYARVRPRDLDQAEVDYVSTQTPWKTRDVLRRAVQLLNALQHVRDVPALRGHLPGSELSPPRERRRARRIDWDSLPPAFRRSFDTSVQTYCHGDDELEQALITRIEAGEDPDVIIAEAEAGLGRLRGVAVADPKVAAERFRAVLRWLVRAYGDSAGDVMALTDVRELMTSEVVKAAIYNDIARAKANHHMKDSLSSSTLNTMLGSLISFARHGLRDQSIAAVIDLLRYQHYELPRRRRWARGDQDTAVADEIARKLRRSPQMGVAFAHGPQRDALLAERRLAEARQFGGRRAEKSSLILMMSAAMLAIQMSRPQRISNLKGCASVPLDLSPVI